MLTFDVSGSMAADDVEPTRLDAAKALARDDGRAPAGRASSSASSRSATPASPSWSRPARRPRCSRAIDRLVPTAGTSLGRRDPRRARRDRGARAATPTEYYSNRSPDPTAAPDAGPAGQPDAPPRSSCSATARTRPPDPLAARRPPPTRASGSSRSASARPRARPRGGGVPRPHGATRHAPPVAEGTAGSYLPADDEEAVSSVFAELAREIVVADARSIEVTALFAGARAAAVRRGGALSLARTEAAMILLSGARCSSCSCWSRSSCGLYAGRAAGGGPRPRATRASRSSTPPARSAAAGGATCRSRCSLAAIAALVLAMARPTAVVAVPDHRTHDRPRARRLAEHVRVGHRADPARGRAGRGVDFVSQQAAGTRIGLVGVQRVRGGDPGADRRPGRRDRGDRQPADGPRDGGRQRDPERDRRDRRGRPQRRASTGHGRPGTEPPPVADGAYEPDVIVLLTDGATNAGIAPKTRRSRRGPRAARVHDRVRDRAGRRRSARCAPQFVGREPGAGGAGSFGGRWVRRRRPFRRGIDEDALIEVADLTGGTYSPAESAASSRSSRAADVDHHAPRARGARVGFVGSGPLAAGGVLLGRAWRPLP